MIDTTKQHGPKEEIRDGRLVIRDEQGRIVSAKVHIPQRPAPATEAEYADLF